MDFVQRMNSTIGYIERHLDGEINYQDIAEIVACPIDLFQRMFVHIAGMSLTEYIRRRRLTQAAYRLQTSDCKVIDLALQYGYESADSFCTAFKRMHGVAPTAARQQNVKLQSFHRLTFNLSITGNEAMAYRLVDNAAFRAVGRIVNSSLEDNVIPHFWDQCKSDGTLDRLRALGLQGASSPTLGICFGYDEAGRNDYMVGVETSGATHDGYTTIEIPASSWLVFESVGPINPTLGNLWRRIYGEFLPQSRYTQTAAPTLEVYSREDTMADDYYCEVWIPVTAKA